MGMKIPNVDLQLHKHKKKVNMHCRPKSFFDNFIFSRAEDPCKRSTQASWSSPNSHRQLIMPPTDEAFFRHILWPSVEGM